MATHFASDFNFDERQSGKRAAGSAGRAPLRRVAQILAAKGWQGFPVEPLIKLGASKVLNKRWHVAVYFNASLIKWIVQLGNPCVISLAG